MFLEDHDYDGRANMCTICTAESLENTEGLLSHRYVALMSSIDVMYFQAGSTQSTSKVPTASTSSGMTNDCVSRGGGFDDETSACDVRSFLVQYRNERKSIPTARYYTSFL